MPCETSAINHSRQRQCQLSLWTGPRQPWPGWGSCALCPLEMLRDSHSTLKPERLPASHKSPIPQHAHQHVVFRQYSVSSSHNHLGFVLLFLLGLQINFFLCSLFSSEVSSLVVLGELPSCSLVVRKPSVWQTIFLL